eukprot:GHVR01011380.1.p1 GENE.GHVR01011380.1~~GHVR01011380.1.p1  ORF type:complete len:101 (-),score=0.57 GHVR01011380.1:554-856(-)
MKYVMVHPINPNLKCSILSLDLQDSQKEGKYCKSISSYYRCDKFYDPKKNGPSRTTSLGYGHKYDFTKESHHAPPPNTYNLADEFKKNSKKGFGFGEGRS